MRRGSSSVVWGAKVVGLRWRPFRHLAKPSYLGLGLPECAAHHQLDDAAHVALLARLFP